VTGGKKDRRVAETEPEEENLKINEIIARPPVPISLRVND